MATIKSLLAMSVEQLETMTDEQLKEYCAPFLRIAVVKEPEETTKLDLTESGPSKTTKQRKKAEDNWQEQATKLAKTLGLDLNIIKLPKKL